jgi:hypothetical protein
MRAEISYDLVMEDDMAFAEGTFRLPQGEWQVFIFTKLDPVQQVEVKPGRWESGVSGVYIQFPRSEKLDKGRVKAILSETLGVTEWIEVRGPDSMQVR